MKKPPGGFRTRGSVPPILLIAVGYFIAGNIYKFGF